MVKNQFLKNAPLFGVLTDAERRLVARAMDVARFPKGSVLFEEGRPAHAFYLVKSGLLSLVERSADGRVVANIGPGGLAGEMDVLRHQPYGVTGVARTDLDTWVMTAEHWAELVAQHPSIAVKLSAFLGEPLMDLTGHLEAHLATCDLLANVSPESRRALAERMVPELIPRGALIFQAGAKAESAFFLEAGEVILVSTSPDIAEPFRQIGPGEFFGHIALVTGDTYGAVARAATEVQLWRLGRDDMNRLLETHADLRRAFTQHVKHHPLSAAERTAAEEMLRRVPLFSSVPDDALDVVAGHLEVYHLADGEQLFRAGAPGDAFYLVNRGTVEVVEGDEVLDELQSGDHVGEMALLTGRAWPYSARAAEPSTLWVLSKADFDIMASRFPAMSTAVSQRLQQLLGEETAPPETPVISALRRFPLFAAFTAEELEELAAQLEEVHVPAGHTLYRLGELAEAFYLLHEGEVRLEGPGKGSISVRSPGFFGEVGLLTGNRQRETAHVVRDATLLVLPRQAFEAMLSRHPQVTLTLTRVLTARLMTERETEAPSPPTAEPAAAPARQVAAAPVTAVPAAEADTHPGLLAELITWFVARSTAAKVRLVVLAILLLWLTGIAAPSVALSAMFNGNGRAFLEGSSNVGGGEQVVALASDPTATPAPTETSAPTATPVPTETPTPVPTATPAPTETPTPVPTATPTNTPAPTATHPPAQAEAAQQAGNTTARQVRPPTATPAPPKAPPEPPRNLDPRLGPLGVSIQSVDVPSGQAYWRVIEVLWRDEQEAQGRHSVNVEVLDENGNRIVGQPVVFAWADGRTVSVTENKPFPEYATNFPMYAAGQAYSVWVDGLPSERVNGLGLGDIEERWRTVHVEYMIKFQRVLKP
ncbi:MAG: cyclic nucleotide-binding domain-containing protein [Ardenticatenia bacterium]|nr:cyclic nucleotide-binding domain-containing protein [Ardenticatenia bacterium]